MYQEGIFLRLGKKTGKTGIGQKRAEGEAFKRKNGGEGKHRGSYIRRVSSKRASENQVYKLMKELVAQEYSQALGGSKSFWLKHELDHLHGRNKPGFVFGAFLSPTNFQWLTAKQHAEKTNPSKGSEIGQRHDFRTLPVQERLVELEARLVKKVGEVWDLKDLKEAVESEIYAE